MSIPHLTQYSHDIYIRIFILICYLCAFAVTKYDLRIVIKTFNTACFYSEDFTDITYYEKCFLTNPKLYINLNLKIIKVYFYSTYLVYY